VFAEVRPRSGLSLKGGVAILGTIDKDYRDEICVIFHAVKNMMIYPGDRIAQLRVSTYLHADNVEVKAVERKGGFGSTDRV
jgi:dUTPase